MINYYIQSPFNTDTFVKQLLSGNSEVMLSWCVGRIVLNSKYLKAL